MTVEPDYVRMCGESNQHFTREAAEIAREALGRLNPERLASTRWWEKRRAHSIMADCAMKLIVAARAGSTQFSHTDLPVALKPGEDAGYHLDPLADAAGELAAALARAATVLAGAVERHLTEEWVAGPLEDVRTAAKDVLRKAGIADGA